MKTKQMFPVAASLAALTAIGAGIAVAQESMPAKSCGKQWTIADTNNDLVLSREEAEASREMDFSRLDQDGDGQISQAEWAACSDMALAHQALRGIGGDQERGEAASNEQASSAQQQADSAEADARPIINGLIVPDARVDDADQSGDLSREELVDSMRQKYSAASEAARQEAREPAGEEGQAWFSGAWFKLHDTNGDGRVSPEELTDADLEGASKRAFGRVDENGDGIISKDEFGKWMTTRYEAAQEKATGGQPATVWHYYVLND